MALTVTMDKAPQLVGTQKRVSGTITFDSSYVTGGEPLTLSSLGLYALTGFVGVNAASTATNQYIVGWDRSQTAPKLKVFQGDNTNAAAAPAIEVPNATNLSALVINYEATGY